VNYTIKIVFETQDDRVKSGMSVTAQIVILMKPDVFVLPNATIRVTGGNSTVNVLKGTAVTDPVAFTIGVISDATPESKQIETGVSDDQNTEIVSGLSEGDVVVLRTVTVASASASSQSSRSATSAVRIPGIGTGGAPGGR
jgi:macrolide-specific efflux system membrane fusion protein